MMKHMFFTILLLLTATPHAKDKIAPYILDGSLVIYSPNIQQATSVWAMISKQTSGKEYVNITNRLSGRLASKLSTNPFLPNGAKSLGIDYNGGVAYVQLQNGVGYMVFTIKNKSLLQSKLNTLTTPIPHRIEGNFVIFSSSTEILEYYNFQGISKLQEYNSIAKQINLSWNKNFLWIDSSLFQEEGVRTMGNRIAGTFNIIGEEIALDLVTVYNNPIINDYIVLSEDVQPVQTLTLLDYESGVPAITGNMYVNFSNFVELNRQVDKADYLLISGLVNGLLTHSVDIKNKIMPYLKGRLSYTIRAFKPSQNLYDVTATVGLNNVRVVKENLKGLVRTLEQKSWTVRHKDLFTQPFYGIEFNNNVFWIGVVENHLVFSTKEESLVQYIRNIFQDNKGYLKTLPMSMQRSINNRRVGGQMLIRNPEFLQNFDVLDLFIGRNVLLALSSIKWDFYLINSPELVGRRDIIILDFAAK